MKTSMRYYTIEVLCTCWIREWVFRQPGTDCTMNLYEANREAKILAKDEHCITATVMLDGEPRQRYNGKARFDKRQRTVL